MTGLAVLISNPTLNVDLLTYNAAYAPKGASLQDVDCYALMGLETERGSEKHTQNNTHTGRNSGGEKFLNIYRNKNK